MTVYTSRHSRARRGRHRRRTYRRAYRMLFLTSGGLIAVYLISSVSYAAVLDVI